MAGELGDKELSIKVYIADRPYPLRVKASEEESVRKAAKMVEDKINQFKGSYDADIRDLLAMTSLMFARDVVSKEGQVVVEDTSSVEQLALIESKLTKALGDN